MIKRNIVLFIGLPIAFMTLWSCDGLTTLFHGPKPEEEVPSFTITFDANEASGVVPSPQTAKSGAAITMPGEGGLIKGDNVFTGWNVSRSGGGTSYPPESSYTVTADQIFYAQWTDPAQVYIVTYNANGSGGAAPSPQKVLQGGSISVAGKGNLTNGNNTFEGWNTQADGLGKSYNAGATLAVTGNTTLYAQWIDPSVKRYTVTYLANGAGGTAPSAQTVTEGANITLPGAGGLTNSGKIFNGWNTTANGSGTVYAEGASYTVTANTSFYAQWISAPITPPGATLAEKLAYIAGRADDGAVYDIEVTQDAYLSPQNIMTQGRNVTVRLHGASSDNIPTISLESNGSVFTVGSNTTLILENIVLKGRSSNSAALVKVPAGGILILENGAKITGNKNITTNGGGIYVDGGIVTMNGGKISDNHTPYNSATNSGTGGGVYVTGATGLFTLKGGEISGNIANGGGGFFLAGHGKVIMNGGVIKGNTADTAEGGAIYVYIYGSSSSFQKTNAPGSSTSGIVYGADAGEGLANTPNAIRRYYNFSAKIRTRTLGQFDEFDTTDSSADWD